MSNSSLPGRSIPLCVDLDGTLVKLDTFHQALFLLLRRQPACIFKIIGWLRCGRAQLKEEVFRRVVLDPVGLPYNQPLLKWLRFENTAGRRLILVTAASHRIAQIVSDHLGLFEKVLASSASENLRGQTKLAAIQARYSRFDYAGDSIADLPVWGAAEHAILVNPSLAARRAQAADQLITDRAPRCKTLLQALRVQQWLKNLLIFAPMMLAHRFTNTATITSALLAFASFSLAASAIYIFNDLFDIAADQHHPRKRNRPFAAGNLHISTGVFLVPLLVAASFLLATFLPSSYSMLLLLYLLLTTVYSIFIKRLPIVDIITLSFFYILRIIAGATATETYISPWFISFCFSFFVSLALMKRFGELKEIEDQPISAIYQRERGYQARHIGRIKYAGFTASAIAVGIYVLYTFSNQVIQLYSNPKYLLLISLLLTYWVIRIWIRTNQLLVKDDPLIYVAKDYVTYVLTLVAFTALLLAI